MTEESDTQEGEHTEPGLMYVVCAKCKTWIDSKPGRVNVISHGLCQSCYEEAERQLDAEDAVREDADTRVTPIA